MSFCVTILGCGSSGGVPRIGGVSGGGDWGACDSTNPKNRRRRCSLLVERHGADGGITRVLVDASPDLRMQMLDAGVTRLDALLITHAHADHVHGIDDIRALVLEAGRRLPLYADALTMDVLRQRFGYVFATPPGSDYPPLVDAHILTHGTSVTLTGPGGVIDAVPFRLDHGDSEALGFVFSLPGYRLAYTPDVRAIPVDSAGFLDGLDLWIIDALRYRPHPSHFCLEEALAAIARHRPKHAILTNLHVDMDYATLLRQIPPGVSLAHDGLRVEG